jgi:hypothetical protein
MGLDTNFDCFHGGYGSFHYYRKYICQLAGYPPLELMEGFYGEDAYNPFYWLRQGGPMVKDMGLAIEKQMPIRWDNFKDDALIIFLRHSDCDGKIAWKSCLPIANSLSKLLPNMEQPKEVRGDWDMKEITKRWIKGLKKAHKAKKPVTFG